MSIPSLESLKVNDGDAGSMSGLIERLANELFSQSTKGAGLGRELDVTTSGNGLAGSYPGEVRPFAPSVHPASHTGKKSPQDTVSGEHCPGSAKSYPFGEPKCMALSKESNLKNGSTCDKPSQKEGDLNYYFLPKTDATFAQVPSLPGSSAPAGLGFNINAIRSDFPALHQNINGKPLVWLDNAATTQKPQSVIDSTSQFYGRDNSNIHRAAHTMAARATELFETGREKVRQFIGAGDTQEIVFVRGTTEAINLIAQTFGRQNIGAGDEILLTVMEHHANIVPWQLLAQEKGAVIRVAPINDRGELILDQFASLLTSRTKLVAVTQVANALGTINPIEQIVAIAHSFGVPVLVDGAQSTPHMPINVKALDVDFFTLSGHKIFGPTGIGALYGKADLLKSMPPWQGGGNMIQDVTFGKTTYQGIPAKFEAGTPDIAGVVGLTSAIDYLLAVGLPAIAAYEHELLEYATPRILTIPGLKLIGTAAAKASVLSFVIDGVRTNDIAKYLDQKGIAVRSGHHCAQPSLRRFGQESTVRPSFAFYNTKEEIDYLVESLQQFPRK